MSPITIIATTTGLAIILVVGSVGYAADVCATYAQNGYHDWFLPSMDELLPVRNQGLLDIAQTYWSSTEEDIGQAFAYDAGTDLISVTMKQTMFSSVRPTRRF